MLCSRHSSAFEPPGTDEATAPWNQPDDPRIPFHCLACGKAGYESGEDFTDEYDPLLPDAMTVPDGRWVCCDACYSQAMYNAADEGQKAKLNAVADAVAALQENLDEPTREFILSWMAGSTRAQGNCADRLLWEADSMRQLLSRNAEPSWLNRPSREEALARSAAIALAHLYLPRLNAGILLDGIGDGPTPACGMAHLRRQLAQILAGMEKSAVALAEATK